MNEPFPRIHGQLHAERVPLAEIAKAVGTPSYIYSATRLCEAHDALRAAFRGTRHTICYSIKACANLAVVRTLVAR